MKSFAFASALILATSALVGGASATESMQLDGTVQAEAGCGQPEVIAQRNAADKLLRIAGNEQHHRLTELRGGKDVDHTAANALIGDADEQLRDTLRAALDEVGALTLGRNGHADSADEEVAPDEETTEDTENENTNEDTDDEDADEDACEATEDEDSEDQDADEDSDEDHGKPELTGRAMVAARVTLNETLQAIVDAAVEEMTGIVDDAVDAVADLDPVTHGRSAENGASAGEHGKSDERGGGRGHGRP